MNGPRWLPLRWGSLSMQGSENAAVLPVPVFAAAMTSRPSSANGMARSWTGVGFGVAQRLDGGKGVFGKAEVGERSDDSLLWSCFERQAWRRAASRRTHARTEPRMPDASEILGFRQVGMPARPLRRILYRGVVSNGASDEIRACDESHARAVKAHGAADGNRKSCK